MSEFGILPCCLCKRTPMINKDITKEDEDRYTLSHCGMESKGITETQVIVNWNKLQLEYTEEADE